MENEKHYPLWVRLGLWGATKRGTVILFAFFFLGFSIGEFIDGFWQIKSEKKLDIGNIAIGTVFLLVVLYYYLTLGWMDRNGNWEEAKLYWAKFRESAIAFLLMVGLIAIVVAIMKGLKLF